MKIFDGFQNWVAGIGNEKSDKGANNTYVQTVDNVGRNEALYRTSGFGKRTVDIVSSDATRKWRTWHGDDASDLIKFEKKLGLKQTVRDAIAAGKRTGGAAIYFGFKGISDEQLAEPLDPSTVQQNDLQYVTMFSRTELSPVEYDEDPTSPRFKRGKIFAINRGDGMSLKIHWTRFAWFSGVPTSREMVEIQQGWDDSVYLAWGPYIEAADAALANINALVHEARTDTLKIPGLAQYFETEDSEMRLTKRVLAMARLKSSVHMGVIDKDEEIVTKNMSFTGVVEVFAKGLEALAGVSDIPIVRFLGTSPGGMNSSGQTELHNYYDGVSSYQENDLAASLWQLDAVLWRSVTGRDINEMSYDWTPLYQQSEKEQAETEKLNAETTKLYYDMKLFDDELFAEAVLGRLKQTHLFPTLQEILDEKAADDEFISVEEIEAEPKTQPPAPSDSPAGNA